MTDTPAIELVDATKRYGSSVALDGVSLRIEKGEFFCLLGPSGCGKTTTLNLIGGFIPLTSGELRIEGVRVNDLPPHKRDVNTVFQNYALFPHMTVKDNVAFGLRMAGLGGKEAAARVAEYLVLVGLEGFDARYPNQLSGGQQQRVALARALVKRPAVLLLDEPLGALDLKLRKQMQLELSRIHRQVQTTFVFVTHDQEEALSLGTRIAVMSGGRVMQQGTPREIYYHPLDSFVADFIGESNLMAGIVQANGSGLVFEAGGSHIPAPAGAVAGPATLLVRPEAVSVGRDAPGNGMATFHGRVLGVSFLGAFTRVTVQTGAGPVVASRPNAEGARSADLDGLLDQEVAVWWSPADCVITRQG
ncbi:MAG: ABC transporter ATP-binding protein [Candidatus Limnocylindrales bacterium]